VRTHIQNIIKKMGVHSKLEATTLALQLGIITMPRD
jgi:DNA-binding NarL/FixJ family response regulator